MLALRSHPGEIAQALREEIQDRLEKAGVTVIEARISHLAYAPEIANAMLRRQQASAIIAARKQIVAGAVGMVEMALDELRERILSNWTRSAKRPWSAICWSCFAAKKTRSRSSIPVRFTRKSVASRS